MAGIDELISPQGPHQNPFNGLDAARVTSESDGEVTVRVLSFSNEQSYATVPYIKTGDATPSSGDSAALHSDSDGNPMYAVVFT